MEDYVSLNNVKFKKLLIQLLQKKIEVLEKLDIVFFLLNYTLKKKLKPESLKFKAESS